MFISRSPTNRNSVEHEQGPGGEEYAVVTTSTKKNTPAVDAFYQVLVLRLDFCTCNRVLLLHVCAVFYL